jgi:hypothetical protein
LTSSNTDEWFLKKGTSYSSHEPGVTPFMCLCVNLTQNRKYRFPFEKWILRNGQPVRDDNHIIFIKKGNPLFFAWTLDYPVYMCVPELFITKWVIQVHLSR